MIRPPLFYALIGALVIAMGMAGCQGNPRHTYAEVNETVITTFVVLQEAQQSGEFTQEEWDQEVYPLILHANIAMRQYDILTRAGRDSQPVLNQLAELLTALQPYVQRSNERRNQ